MITQSDVKHIYNTLCNVLHTRQEKLKVILDEKNNKLEISLLHYRHRYVFNTQDTNIFNICAKFYQIKENVLEGWRNMAHKTVQ